MSPKSKGFTLIELLIVVAIIAILAAIAVPNFLEAQTRSKVSRTKTDQRAIATAIEAYHVDNNKYPPQSNTSYAYLSTPIAYLTDSKLEDPFGTEATADVFGTFTVAGAATGGKSFYLYGYTAEPSATVTAIQSGFFNEEQMTAYRDMRYVISGHGPDRVFEIVRDPVTGENVSVVTAAVLEAYWTGYENGTGIYDPTNGTVSRGDISRSGRGEIKGIGLFR